MIDTGLLMKRHIYTDVDQIDLYQLIIDYTFALSNDTQADMLIRKRSMNTIYRAPIRAKIN